MATYDLTTTDTTTALQSSGAVLFTDDTISKILALTTQNDTVVSFDTQTPADNSTIVPTSDVTFVNVSNTATEHFTVTGDAPVLIFQGSGGVSATLTGGTTGQRIVLGTAGNDNFTIADGKTTEIHLGTGTSTVVDNGVAHNTIVAGLGNSIITGSGHTNVSLQGTGIASNFHMTPIIHNIVSTQGNAQAAGTDQVTITNNTTGKTTTISGVQYVAVDGGDALIVAASTVEAGVASLYHAAFGRTGDAGGVDYWFNLVKSGESLHDVAFGMAHSAEFASKDAGLSDTAFITQLYQNTFNRAPDAGGLTYWQQQLTNGMSRVDLLTQFASVAALNEQGTIHTETTIVGTVTIVPHIV